MSPTEVMLLIDGLQNGKINPWTLMHNLSRIIYRETNRFSQGTEVWERNKRDMKIWSKVYVGDYLSFIEIIGTP